MLTMNVIVFSLTIIFLFGVNSCNGIVSCLSCPTSPSINLTTDTDLNTAGCTLEDDDLCSIILRIDYMNSNNSFALFSGSKEAVLLLTNGEPQVSESTFIWFNEYRVQRIASIYCFSGTSCGVDLIKQIYRDKFRLFDYQTIQNRLAEQLYSSSAPSSSLTCADPSGSSVSCSDGFCRSIFDGNGLISYSSCVKKGVVANPYGITVAKTILSDFGGGEQSSIIFTCNKPMCNSKENTQQVLQQLVAAQILPQPTITTTTPSNLAIKITNNQPKLLVSFLFLFSMFKLN